MATTSPVTTSEQQPKRTAIRLLQAPVLESDIPGAAASCRGPLGPGPQPAPLGAQASRRRSATFLLPPTEIIESFSCDASRGGSGGSASAGPASPALQRRVPLLDASADAAALSPSPPGAGGAADPDAPSPHLSVPLTLLSLHNGGLRHSPRAARDVSPSANLLLVTREGSISHPGGDAADFPDFAAAAAAASASPDGAAHGGGCFRRRSDRSSVTGSSPPRRTNSWLLRSAPLPTATFPAASPAASNPARASVTGTAACSSPIPTAAADAVAVGAGARSAPAPLVDAATATATAAAAGGIALPAHLCSHRPPTPVCKEDDLLSSMRHMSSPTRRRSRFASAADSSLMAAAAAAIAAEEAGLLDSPPGHPAAAAAARGGGGGNGGGGNWSYNGLATEPRPGRRAAGSLGSFCSDGGNSSFVGVGFCGGGGGESSVSRSAAAAAAAAAATAGELAARVPSLSASWRTSSQLVTVPEERPQSRADALPLPLPLPLPGVPPTMPATAAAAAAKADAPPPPPVLRGPSFASAGSFPRAATPGHGLVVVSGPGGNVSRRRLGYGSSSNDNIGSSSSSSMGNIGSSGLHPDSALLVARHSADDAAGGADCSELADDALSSFMHNFGPPPGTPSAERRCPVATPADNGGGGGGGGGGGASGTGMPPGGRVTAR